MAHIGDVAKGNWRNLLASLGVESRYLVNKHGPCPMCGGRDRFRWDDWNGKGGYVCSQCGPGDGFDLACKATGKSFREVSDHIAKVMGTSNSFERTRDGGEESAQLDAMRRAWGGSWQPKEGGALGVYLTRRVGCLWPSKSLRESVSREGYPTMVAKVVDHHGLKAVNIHLTFLTLDGRKADITPCKRVMPGKLPPGCAIRLGPVQAAMGVAEGIETAISAAIIHDMPVWACVNGTLLSQWIPPDEAEQITVFGDNDANYTGQAKAFHLANRLEVQFKRRVTVAIPPATGDDWNDYWQKTQVKFSPSFLRIVK